MSKAKLLNSVFWGYMLLTLIQEIVEACFLNESIGRMLAYVLFILILVLLIFLSPYQNRKSSIIIYLSLLSILLINTFLFPLTGELVKKNIVKIAISYLPLLLVFSNITQWQDFYMKMKKYAIPYYFLGIVYFLFYFLGMVDEDATNYMRMAYNVLMPVCLIGYIGIFERRPFYHVVFWLSLVAVFFSGCRGALFVGCCVYAVLLFFSGQSKNKWYAAIASVVFGAIVVVNLVTVEDFFNTYGFESRISKKLHEGALFQSQGRELFQTVVLNDIQSNDFTPQGIFYDRVVTSRIFGDEAYVHNIVLEFIVDFGLVGGILLFLFLVVCIIRVAKKSDVVPKMFLLLYASYSLSKLMLSSSYIVESSFFCMLGVLIAAYRSIKVNKHSVVKTSRMV